MGPIEASFQIVKISEDHYDVLLFSSNPILKSFSEIYEESFLIENSKFGTAIVAIPNFQSKKMVDIFIGYWIKAFQDPSKACQTCPTVKQFFASVEKYSNLDNK